MRLRHVALSALLAVPAHAQPDRAQPDRARLAAAYPAIDSLMRAFAERQHVPGIAYGIVVDGRLVHVGTAGLRDVAARAPGRPTASSRTRAPGR